MGGGPSKHEGQGKHSRVARNTINELQFLEGHSDIVRYLERLDGRRIASAGDDGTILVWDTLTGKCLHKLTGHTLRITGLLSLPCGAERILISGSADKTVRLWNIDGSTEEGDKFDYRKMRARVGEGGAGHCRHGLTVEEMHDLEYSSADGLAPGEYGGSDVAMEEEHLNEVGLSKRCRMVLTGHTGSITCLQKIDSETFCSGGNDSVIYLWRVQDGSVATTIERQEEENLHCLLPISDQRLVTGSNSSFLCTCISPRWGGEIGVHAADVYDIQTSKHQVLAYHRESVRCLVSISETQFASASLDGAIVVWHAQNLTPLKTLTYPEQYLDGTTKAFLYSVRKLVLLSKRYLAAAIGNGFQVFDISNRECILSEKDCHQGAVTDLIPLYNCRRLVTASVNGCIRIWGVESQGAVPALEEVGRVRDVKQAPLTVTAKMTKPVLFGEMWGHADAVSSLVLCAAAQDVRGDCSTTSTTDEPQDGRVQANLRIQMAQRWHAAREAAGGEGEVEKEVSRLPVVPVLEESGPLEPPPAGVTRHQEDVAKPVVPETPSIAVPEYITDYARMLRDEKKYSIQQVRECMIEIGHSESLINALMVKLDE